MEKEILEKIKSPKILETKTIWEGSNGNKVNEITFKDNDTHKEEMLSIGNVSAALIYDTEIEKYIFVE